MSKIIRFSQHEAVLLLDAYLAVINNGKPRSEMVSLASEDLRRMALNRGIEIDDKYRNISGIHFQMASMESAYEGVTVFKPPSKLFLETVKLYRENRSQYDKILAEAKAMAGMEN